MRALGAALSVAVAILYPIAIWVGLANFGARTVGLWILVALVPVIAWRLRRAKAGDRWAVLRVPLVMLGVVSLGAIFDDRRFVLAMPVLVSFALLVVFGASLRGPMTLIERFARMQEKEELSAGQIAHCRQVTWAWCAFFVINAAASAVLGWLAPLSWWAAYTGGIAYGLMGLMFAGEYVVRQYRFRRFGAGLHDRLLSRIFPPRSA